MASTPVINLRKGHAVRYNNEVCLVSAFELKTPPRMASYVQMSIRTLSTGKVYNLRMTSNESLESVNLERQPHEFSYKDGDGYHFMHPETFEDVLLGENNVGDSKDYLIEGQKYTIQFADGLAIDRQIEGQLAEMNEEEQRLLKQRQQTGLQGGTCARHAHVMPNSTLHPHQQSVRSTRSREGKSLWANSSGAMKVRVPICVGGCGGQGAWMPLDQAAANVEWHSGPPHAVMRARPVWASVRV